MPPASDHSSQLFRRVMLGGCIVSLLLFAWSVWMVVHFNATPVSVRLGVGSVLKFSSVVLPGPALLAFLYWTRQSRVSRALGSIAVVPAVAIAVLFAFYTTSLLRPPFAPGEYDAAATDAQTAAISILNADADALKDIKAVRASFSQQPASSEELAGLARRAHAAADQTRAAQKQFAGLEQAVKAPFKARSISQARTDEFARLFAGVFLKGDLAGSYAEAADAYDGFARRLEFLAQHWGKWRWQGEGAVKFDDAALGKVYEAGVPAKP